MHLCTIPKWISQDKQIKIVTQLLLLLISIVDCGLGRTTVLPGKRVDFDHCVVSADFTCESCMYSVSILYTVRSMIGLSTCQIMECNELSSGI